MAYNYKINNNGTYRKFFGWTVICPLEYNMKFLENFIKENNVLSSYFAALPSSSYHVTIYSIWSNFTKLLKPQQDCIDKENERVTRREDELIKARDAFNETMAA